MMTDLFIYRAIYTIETLSICPHPISNRIFIATIISRQRENVSRGSVGKSHITAAARQVAAETQRTISVSFLG